jgi:uncharacterized YigZ family protein
MHQLAAPAFAEIEIKKSRFIGQLYPLQSRSEALSQLAAIRAAHPGAVHVCWALICTGDSGLDDDGEPSGTAAKPMYNVLVHKDVMNVLAVVVRYWGGIKLGAGGLTRAYGQAISEAFKLASLIPVETLCSCMVTVAYADESQVRHVADKFSAQITDIHYTGDARLTISLKARDFDALRKELIQHLKGQVRIDSELDPASPLTH